MMKIFKFYSLIFLIGCTSTINDLEIGEPFDNAAAIVDQWDLVEVRHVDDLDINKRYTDVSNFFLASSAEIEFTESSFTYLHGSGPNYLEDSGNWAFDDPDFPEALTLNTSTELVLKEPIRSFSDTLVLILERKCEEKTVSSYEYYFKRK